MTIVGNSKVPSALDEDKDQRKTGFFNRRVVGGKSWGWITRLLIIPVALTIGGIIFSTCQHNADQQRALDQQQATILQTYIDNIQDLLLNYNLLKPNRGEEVTALARARTLTALQGLDRDRKGVLLNFLYESHLIGYSNDNHVSQDSIIDLSKANLSDANLTNAILDSARLYDTILIGANLSDADLTQTNLRDANLANVNLTRTKLDGTDLRDANLSSAQNLTQQQLDQVSSCYGAILPQGLTCHHQSP